MTNTPWVLFPCTTLHLLKRIRNLLIKFQHFNKNHFRGWYCICRAIIIPTVSVASWYLRILVMFWGCSQQLNECPSLIAVIMLSIIMAACPLLPWKDWAMQENDWQKFLRWWHIYFCSFDHIHCYVLIWDEVNLPFISTLPRQWILFDNHPS